MSTYDESEDVNINQDHPSTPKSHPVVDRDKYLDPQKKSKRLRDEIQQLYEVVATELNDARNDARFAAEVLTEADHLLIETPDQYAEARYRVALVKTMLARRKNLSLQTRTSRSFIIVYTLVWLIAIIAAFGFDSRFSAILWGSSEGVDAIGIAWFTALAGGLGGVVSVLYTLSWRRVIEREFDLRVYLGRPVIGFVIGGVIFLFAQIGLPLFSYISNQDALHLPSSVVMPQMLIALIVGFRQSLIINVFGKKEAINSTD